MIVPYNFSSFYIKINSFIRTELGMQMLLSVGSIEPNLLLSLSLISDIETNLASTKGQI